MSNIFSQISMGLLASNLNVNLYEFTLFLQFMD
jgi:hypothetical protein